ncbi:MAG: hypothetical protein AAF587_09810 [Bacteroidota bacterium]
MYENFEKITLPTHCFSAYYKIGIFPGFLVKKIQLKNEEIIFSYFWEKPMLKNHKKHFLRNSGIWDLLGYWGNLNFQFKGLFGEGEGRCLMEMNRKEVYMKFCVGSFIYAKKFVLSYAV